MRPQRASRATSTMGAKVQCRPAAVASSAATCAAASTAAGSQLEASASGTGKVVRKPWMTSNANNSGMCRRECSTASVWSSRVKRAP